MISNAKRKRELRAAEKPIVGSLPQFPGIVAAFKLSSALETHLRGLAQVLLVDDFPGATLTRGERELIATHVCRENECFYGMDLHGAVAGELLRREGHYDVVSVATILEHGIVNVMFDHLEPLLKIASLVRRSGRLLRKSDVDLATEAGHCDANVQLTVLIASAYGMYNRITDGLRAKVSATPQSYSERAIDIAERGYVKAHI